MSKKFRRSHSAQVDPNDPVYRMLKRLEKKDIMDVQYKDSGRDSPRANSSTLSRASYRSEKQGGWALPKPPEKTALEELLDISELRYKPEP